MILSELLKVVILAFVFASSTFGFGRPQDHEGKRDPWNELGLNFTGVNHPFMKQVGELTGTSSYYKSPNGKLTLKVVRQKETVDSTLVFHRDGGEFDTLEDSNGNQTEFQSHLIEECITAIKDNRIAYAKVLLDKYRDSVNGTVPPETIKQIVNECAGPESWSYLARFFDITFFTSVEEMSIATEAFLKAAETKHRLFTGDSARGFDLVVGMSQIVSAKSGVPVTDEQRSRIKSAFDNLPDAMKLVSAGDEVTLRSAYFNKEYLYAASEDLAHDNDRRNVFTWVPGDCCGEDYKKCVWTFEHVIGNGFVLRNTYFRNEYLYPSVNDFNYDDIRRRVFTWRPGGLGDAKDRDQMTWNLEIPNDNTLKLKSQRFKGEVLHASGLLRDKDRRSVFTWINTTDVVQSDEWIVEPGTLLEKACQKPADTNTEAFLLSATN